MSLMPKSPRFGHLGLRIISAIVLAGVGFLVFSLGPVWVESLLLILFVLMGGEWTALVMRQGQGVPKISWVYLWGAVWIALGAWGILSLFQPRCNLYLAEIFPCCPVLFRANCASCLLASLIISVSLSDGLAYFAGSLWGKKKLCPSISPNKTWLGALVGLGGGVAGGMWMMHYFFQTPSRAVLLARLIFFALAVAFSQGGDLVASLGKRILKVKDSSNLIPGHGGLLDRFDGLLGVGFFLFFLQYVLD